MDENSIPSHSGEDRHVIDIIPSRDLQHLTKEDSRSLWEKWAAFKLNVNFDLDGDGSDDLVFVSVFDGNGGSADVSKLLQTTLHPCLAFSLACVDRSDSTAVENSIKQW